MFLDCCCVVTSVSVFVKGSLLREQLPKKLPFVLMAAEAWVAKSFVVGPSASTVDTQGKPQVGRSN